MFWLAMYYFWSSFLGRSESQQEVYYKSPISNLEKLIDESVNERRFPTRERERERESIHSI
jgi:hypothetical protein